MYCGNNYRLDSPFATQASIVLGGSSTTQDFCEWNEIYFSIAVGITIRELRCGLPRYHNHALPHMAQEAFSFLERAGFRLTESGPARLQYETAQAFVTIEWDSRSGEFNVFVGLQWRKGEAGNALPLTDLLAAQGVDAPDRRMPFQIAEESKLGPFLDKLANDMQVHAQPALAGDRMFFHRLNTFRSAQAHAYMRDMEPRRVRTEADKAWQKWELDKMVALYSSIEDQLTASEKAKLPYAKQHQAH